MAFRGIDMQIMATKAQELATERARADRQNDVLANQAALRGKEVAEQEQNRPPVANKVEGPKIRSDEQGGHAQPEYFESERREKELRDAPPSGHELLELPVDLGEKSKKKYTFDATV